LIGIFPQTKPALHPCPAVSLDLQARVISAIFWGWLWGPIGLIISMPITLCLVVLGRHVERLAFLQVLLGDLPALTKSETFYQRLLSGDTDDLQEQAEEALKESTLSSYDDEVAMPGLEMAARVIARVEADNGG
jgi:hypothetical protein